MDCNVSSCRSWDYGNARMCDRAPTTFMASQAYNRVIAYCSTHRHNHLLVDGWQTISLCAVKQIQAKNLQLAKEVFEILKNDEEYVK